MQDNRVRGRFTSKPKNASNSAATSYVLGETFRKPKPKAKKKL